MGQRCNLLIVEGGSVELRYSHWAANRLDAELFWGPEQAARFIRAQRGVDDGAEWLDEVWAEGGAVLDLDRRALCWFGGEDIEYDVPLRRLYHELAAVPWAGFSLRWAAEGIAELADAVGKPRAEVLVERTPPSIVLDDDRLSAVDGWVLLTVRGDDGVVRWACPSAWSHGHVTSGETLLEAARAVTRTEAGRLAEWPSAGLHVDLREHRLDVWTAPDAPEMSTRLERAYPGWTTAWHRDRYEAQLDAVQGLVAMPAIDLEAQLAWMRSTLLGTHRPMDMAASAELVHPGKDVHINPLALRDDMRELPVDERSRVLEAAIAAWRARR